EVGRDPAHRGQMAEGVAALAAPDLVAVHAFAVGGLAPRELEPPAVIARLESGIALGPDRRLAVGAPRRLERAPGPQCAHHLAEVLVQVLAHVAVDAAHDALGASLAELPHPVGI